MSLDFNSIPEDQISAVHALKGRTLNSGWEVIEKVTAKPGSTGGNFSVCYLVKKDGNDGFLKALNILSFLRDEDPDLPQALAEMLNSFNFEKEVLQRCADKNLSKVSRILYSGEENIKGFLVANVYYMIFEKAEDDVRSHLNFAGKIDIAWKLRSLHNIATGLKQLHGIKISHQDLKPSNIFIFDKVTSKVGDLGRSLCENLDGPHSSLNFSGDMKYAPPEVFHKYVLPEWKDKVFAIDCFLLGSMACYYLVGQNMTALLSKHMDPSISILSMKFEQALPYWIKAFDDAIEAMEKDVQEITNYAKIIEAIRMLCDPDPRERGHIKNVLQKNSRNYGLERFVEIFNLLASKAEFELAKG